MSPAGEPRVVLVTGASRGFGAHLAAAFADAGDVVEGCSRRGSRAHPWPVAAVEATDPEAVASYVESLLDRHGRIDVLVNNAGVLDAEVPLAESDPDDWWRAVEVNVRGPYLFTRAVLPAMLAAGRGCVVNLNSGAGTRHGEVSTAYHVGKTALARLTGSTAHEGAGSGVVAFDLMPGVVRTDMTAGMESHRDRTAWTSPQEVAELVLALAGGGLDAWSGRFVRAGVDTVESLRREAASLQGPARTVGLIPYGPKDPVA